MWLLLALALLFLHYLYVRRKFDKFAYMGLPHQPGIYPFGSWVNWQVMMGQVPFLQAHEKVAQMFPGAKVVGYYGMGGAPKIVIVDMDLVKRVFVKDFDHFPDRNHGKLNAKANRYLANSLSVLKVEKWKEVRSLVSPIFSSSKLKALMPTMHDVTTEWLELLERTDKNDIDIKANITPALSEFMARIGCGVKPAILVDNKPHENRFYNAVMKILGKAGQGTLMMKFLLFTMFPKLVNFLKVPFFDPEATEFLAGTIKDSIKMRRESKVKMNDFIDFLMETMDNLDKSSGGEETEFSAYTKAKNYKVTEKLSQQQVEDLIVGFGFETFTSGVDTSGGAFAITTYFLACHLDLQEQIFQEIEEAILNNDGDQRLSYTQIHNLKLLDAFIKESQRSHGMSFLERICVKDYYIPDMNITITKGSKIQVAGSTIMHDEKYYPNPDSFDPAGHFLSDSFVPSTFLAFGAGPHNCIGMRFGLTIVKTMLATLLAKYKILPGPGFQHKFEIDPMDVNALPKGGVHIKLELRD